MFGDRINFGVMLRLQHFYNISCAKGCYWWVKKLYRYWAQIRISSSLPHWICCECSIILIFVEFKF